MTRQLKYPCYSMMRWSSWMPSDLPPIPCERRVKKGDMWACPHLLSGGTWADCEAGGKREARLAEVKAKVQTKLATDTDRKMVKPDPPPRYDEDFYEFTKWLDENG